jgi:ABC-2 type transport system ATP-binding protein
MSVKPAQNLKKLEECRMNKPKVSIFQSASVDAQIAIHDLCKTYRIAERGAGSGAALKSLAWRTFRDVEAVREINFSVQAGEVIGFIGPNGAGKTTTLKMLAGLLHPTAGEARVAGFIPWKRSPDFLRSIAMVMGNKSQLLWDIPPLDSFQVLGEIYNLPAADFRRSLDELVELLDLQELLTRPARNLSLGERMKCELAAGLLHRPRILFLDEPTLGLDVSMQKRLRQFIAEYNRRHSATVILTSHYMADVAVLCERVILIHQGRVLYDGALSELARRLAPYKLVRVSVDGSGLSSDGVREFLSLPENVDVLEQANGQVTLRVSRAETPALTAHLLRSLPVTDLTVEDPPVEAVIDQIYQEGKL